MKFRYIWSGLVLASLLLSACQNPQPEPTMTAVGAVTTVPTATHSPATPTVVELVASPSVALAPTETPAPMPTVVPLSGTGPYLLVSKSDSSGTYLVAFDQDGVGRQRIDLPAGYELRHSLMESLSVQGRYLGLYHGQAGEAGDANDLTLGLLDLATGELATEIPLLSVAYPEDLRARFEQLKPASNPEYFPQSFEDFQSVLVYGIETLAWSPNGRYLAFAGQTDGPTSDAYVLDTRTLQRRRLSDGDEHIAYLQWSPDGRRLLTTSTNIIAMGPTNHLFSIDLQSDTNIALNADLTNIGYWLDAEHVWMDFDTNGDFSSRGARIANATTGAALEVWPGSFDLVSLNWPDRKVILMGCPLNNLVEAACGEYTVDLTTGAATRVGPVDRSKLLYNWAGDPDAPRRLEDQNRDELLLAPDRVELISAAGERWALPVDPEVWADLNDFALAPDGRHLFAQLFNRLEVLDLETGALRVVDPALGDALHGLAPYDNLAWATVVPQP